MYSMEESQLLNNISKIMRRTINNNYSILSKRLIDINFFPIICKLITVQMPEKELDLK
jgi:hypothetical protein